MMSKRGGSKTTMTGPTKTLSMSLLANFLLAGLVIYSSVGSLSFTPYISRAVGRNVAPSGLHPHGATHKIAVIAPSICDTIDDMIGGFKGVLNESTHSNYEFEVYYGNGSRTLLKSIIEDVIDKKFDLIFPIGIHCSILTKEITTKKHHFTPIVFGAVDDPVAYNLVDSIEHSGNHVTGAAAERQSRHMEQLERFLFLQPKISKVIIPYNPGTSYGFISHLDDIENRFKKLGIATKRIEIFHSNQIVEKVSPFIVEHALVFVLRDATIMTGTPALVKLCNNYGATVFSSDIGGVEKGAAVGFGARDADTGIEAGKKALQILEQGIKPTDIPVTVPDYKYKLIINSKTMKKQKLEINPHYLFLMENGEVI